MRERTAEGILRMLGKRPMNTEQPEPAMEPSQAEIPFGEEERNMVSGVLRLADRSVHSIMTPRTDITWINLDDSPDDVRREIAGSPHGFFPVCRGSLDDIVGIGRAKDLSPTCSQKTGCAKITCAAPSSCMKPSLSST